LRSFPSLPSRALCNHHSTQRTGEVGKRIFWLLNLTVRYPCPILETDQSRFSNQIVSISLSFEPKPAINFFAKLKNFNIRLTIELPSCEGLPAHKQGWT
jgi:hypothetical protein